MKKYESLYTKLRSLKEFFGGQAKIYIFPTGSGLGILMAVILCILGGAIYSNNLLYLMSFILLTLFALICLMNHQNIRRLYFSDFHFLPTFSGSAIPLTFSLENRNRDPKAHLNILFRLRKSKGLRTSYVRSDADILIEGKNKSSFSVYFPTMARGRYEVDRIRVETRFPFGLLRSWVVLPASLDFFVYPEPMGDLKLPVGNHAAEEGAGEFHTLLPVEFYDLEKFREGEPPNRIHWQSYARHRQVLSKKMGTKGAQRIVIENQSLSHLQLESQLSQLTRWLVNARAAGFITDVKDFFKDKRRLISRQDYENTLKYLATYKGKST